jgi:hypothetical protein
MSCPQRRTTRRGMEAFCSGRYCPACGSFCFPVAKPAALDLHSSESPSCKMTYGGLWRKPPAFADGDPSLNMIAVDSIGHARFSSWRGAECNRHVPFGAVLRSDKAGYLPLRSVYSKPEVTFPQRLHPVPGAKGPDEFRHYVVVNRGALLNVSHRKLGRSGNHVCIEGRGAVGMDRTMEPDRAIVVRYFIGSVKNAALDLDRIFERITQGSTAAL